MWSSSTLSLPEFAVCVTGVGHLFPRERGVIPWHNQGSWECVGGAALSSSSIHFEYSLCLTFLPHCGSTEARLHLCIVSAEPGSVVNSQITWSNILHKQGRRDIITSQIFLRFSGLMDLFDFFVRLCLQIIQIKPEDLATLYLQISHWH